MTDSLEFDCRTIDCSARLKATVASREKFNQPMIVILLKLRCTNPEEVNLVAE